MNEDEYARLPLGERLARAQRADREARMQGERLRALILDECDPGPILHPRDHADLTRATSDHSAYPVRFDVGLDDQTVAGLQRASKAAGEAFATFARHAADTYAKVRAVMDRIDPAPEEPPTDPRERALWVRRNRNTGPAHDPHRHRGRRR